MINEYSTSPEVVHDQEHTPDTDRRDLGNVGWGDELERSDTDTCKELADELYVSL